MHTQRSHSNSHQQLNTSRWRVSATHALQAVQHLRLQLAVLLHKQRCWRERPFPTMQMSVCIMHGGMLKTIIYPLMHTQHMHAAPHDQSDASTWAKRTSSYAALNHCNDSISAINPAPQTHHKVAVVQTQDFQVLVFKQGVSPTTTHAPSTGRTFHINCA
jgi:hypothetical protein